MKEAKDILYCTAMYLAAQNGHRTTVKYISEMDYTISEDTVYKATAFYLAAQNGQLDTVKYLINNMFLNPSNIELKKSNDSLASEEFDKKTSDNFLIKIADNYVNINDEDKHGNSMLHHAAEEGNVEFVNHLIKRGANIKSMNNYEDRPIHLAARSGFNQVVKILVEHGAYLNVMNVNKDTPLHFAAKNNHTIVVKELLKSGAKHLRNKYGYLPIHYSSTDVIDTLLEQDNDDYKDANNNTLVHISAMNGHCNILKKVLKSNINIDDVNKEGNTALHLAAIHGQEDAVKCLIQNKANLEILQGLKLYPSYSAIMNKYDNIALLLLEAISDCTNPKYIYLHYAAVHGRKNLAEVLIKKGCDVTKMDEGGKSPLMYAAQANHPEICEMLLDFNINIIDLTNKFKKSALHYAVENKKIDTVKILLEYKAKLLTDDHNNTPLTIAKIKGYKDIAKILTEYQKKHSL